MKLKKLDYVVIASLILITISSSLFKVYSISKSKNYTKYAEISVDNKLYKTIPISNHKETIYIDSENGHNTIVIENDEVYISYADCPDKICIKNGKIKNVGEIIVCLPNKVVVQIKGNKKDNDLDSVTF